MGILSGLLGNASQADVVETEELLARILADGERVEQAFRLVRDMLIFTDRRFLLIDRQGMTGRKAEYHSIPIAPSRTTRSRAPARSISSRN